jgi:Tfp pilus assembly protein PilF
MYHLKKHIRIIFMLTVVGIMAALISGAAIQTSGDQNLIRADELFRSGQFDEAASRYTQAAGKDPASYDAVIGLARIYMLRNSLENAEAYVKKAMALKPGDKGPQSLMGEILYRQDKYFQAAPYFDAFGQNAKAEKMRAFENKKPFLIESGPEAATLPFIQTDPLPIIELTIN